MVLDGRQEKWDKYFENYKVNNARLATFQLTAENALKILKNRRTGKVLDIGCGNGLIDIVLAKNSKFEITGCDISGKAISEAKEKASKAGVSIVFEEEDAYALDYPNNYFDVILSFGYSAAATYERARKETYRVLKPGGLFVCDFINHRSLYKLLFFPKNLILGYAKLKEVSEIKNKFKKDNFEFVSMHSFNTFPPVFGKIIPPKIYILFERVIGSLLKSVLGRTLLFCFKKN